MTAMPAEPARRLDLDGALNFRDLGGYRSTDGRRVRWRRVFRSDSLAALSDGDVAHLCDEIGIATVVDLRAGHEIEEFPCAAPRDRITYHHVPVIDETRYPDRPATDLALDAIYLLMLERFGDRLVAAVRILADGHAHPAVVHCAAGKDRTGLVSALVLGALGVPDEVVAADYALTADMMPSLLARSRARAQRGEIPEVREELFAADASVMLAVLATLRDHHGSVDGYLRAHGLEPGAVASLREALLTPAP